MKMLLGLSVCVVALGVVWASVLLGAQATCQPLHPDTDICLIVAVSDAVGPVEHVTVKAGPLGATTDKRGTVTFDVPKRMSVMIQAIAPIGYKPDTGRTIGTGDLSGRVNIVLEKR